MDLIKLEIDGKRVIANNRQTILEVARENGIGNIPTLCHDGQLEPFASCFVCVVKVRGARTLLPACSTKVSGGMMVETNTPEVRRSRKAALELMLSNHFADCIGPCQLACPAGIDIQGYIALAALGKFRDAIRLIKERNPLPAVCGRVCTRPCEVKGCRRTMLDDAVGIDYIKRYIADLELGQKESFRPSVAAPNGRKVAVVGAGPAGLSCAYYLAQKGYAVQLLEALPETGGMLRYGIPEYRLPKEVLDLEVSQVLDLGVKLSTNVSLGKDFTIGSLKQDGFDAIFLGLGAWESSKMRVQNEQAPQVLAGIDFLKQVALHRAPPVRGRVLVVGGGNTAIDCARTSLRLGADEVRLLYRRTRVEMPANEMEIVEAIHEGVQLDLLVAPVRVIETDGKVTGLECMKMELGEPDASGRRSPKPVRGSEFVIDCDYILAAIGQNTKVQELVDGRVPNFLPFGEVLNLTRWQTIQVNDKTFETSVEGVFSGGDVVTGAATAIEAIAAGRKAAYAIDKYLGTGKAQPEPVEITSRKDSYRKVALEDLRDSAKSDRRKMPAMPPEESRKSFSEVEQGYSPDDLRREVRRCMECGCSVYFDCDLRRFATEYQVDVNAFKGEAKEYRIDRTHPLMELDPNKCILCGRCVRMCAEVVGISAYGFVNRGFDTIVRPALGQSLLETECASCGLCIGTCPTGAVAEKIPLVKPGPWQTTPAPTVCAFCGVGCRINYDVFGDTLVKASRSEDGGPTRGHHCKKGRFGYRDIQSPERLRRGMIRAGRELQGAPLEETIRYAAIRLKELVRRHPGEEIALFVSPRMTNEEIYLAQKFARVALKTHNVTSFSQLVNGGNILPWEVVSDVAYPDLLDAQVILTVNADLAEENFVADLLTKKAIRSGARLLYIGPEPNRTSQVAEVFVRCRDGGQAAALAAVLKEYSRTRSDALEGRPELGRFIEEHTDEQLREISGANHEEIIEAARVLAGTLLKVLVFNKDCRRTRTSGDERFYAEAAAALGCGILALREKANMQGLLDMGANPGWLPGYVSTTDPAAIDRLEKEWCVSLPSPSGVRDIAELLREKKIKVAVVLGEDPLGVEDLPLDLREGLEAVDFLVVGDLFLTMTASSAHVVLPLSSPGESEGSMTNHERRVQTVKRAVPPAAGMDTAQILCDLAGRMGFRFKMRYTGIDEVTAEIRRVLPLYRDVVPGSNGSDSIWDLAAFPLRRVTPDYDAVLEPVSAVRTLFLDERERRFEAWFDDAISEARRAVEESKPIAV